VIVQSEEDAAFAHAAVPPQETVRYGPHQDQVVDLYHAADPDAPIAILLHGGFWKQEYDRSHLTPFAAHLAEQGITAALAEYRRVGVDGAGGWPRTFDDVAAAVDTVVDFAGDRPVVLFGHSAGGHLALWSAARHQLPADAPGHRGAPLPLRRVVALAPVADLVSHLRRVPSHATIVGLLGGVQDGAANLAYADPLTLLREHGTTGIPTVLLHGALDQEVPPEQSEVYAAADAAVRLLVLPGVGHYAPIDPDTAACSQLIEELRQAL
jgi:tryptophan 2,3-dioxygenase